MAAKRSTAVDIVKGIAIALVVFEHVAQGANRRDWWTPDYYRQLRYAIYSFHMASFFFVSGMFVAGSIAKRGPKWFATDKLKTVLYPYLLWAAPALLLPGLVSDGGAKGKMNFSTFLTQFLSGEASWFLPSLFITLMLALATIKLPDWLRFALAVAVSLLWRDTGFMVIDRGIHYFAFVALGQWVGTRILKVQPAKYVAAIAAVAAFVCVTLIAGQMVAGEKIQSYAVLLGLGILGTAGLFMSARVFEDSPIGKGLNWIGQASLAIFLLHPYFQGGSRMVIQKVLHSHAPIFQVGLATVVAVLAPAVIWHLRDRLRINWMFEWPFRDRSQPTGRHLNDGLEPEPGTA